MIIVVVVVVVERRTPRLDLANPEHFFELIEYSTDRRIVILVDCKFLGRVNYTLRCKCDGYGENGSQCYPLTLSSSLSIIETRLLELLCNSSAPYFM